MNIPHYQKVYMACSDLSSLDVLAFFNVCLCLTVSVTVRVYVSVLLCVCVCLCLVSLFDCLRLSLLESLCMCMSLFAATSAP